MSVTGVTPNQLTTTRLLVGLGAAAAFAVGDSAWTWIASGLFIASLVLDRADGILARMTGQTSEAGHRYDLFADSICNTLAFVGIGVGLRDSVIGYWSVPLGLVTGLAVAAVLWLVLRIEKVSGPRAAELGSTVGFDADDAMLLVPIAMLLGWGVELLCAAAVGATAFAAFFFWRFRDRA